MTGVQTCALPIYSISALAFSIALSVVAFDSNSVEFATGVPEYDANWKTILESKDSISSSVVIYDACAIAFLKKEQERGKFPSLARRGLG